MRICNHLRFTQGTSHHQQNDRRRKSGIPEVLKLQKVFCFQSGTLTPVRFLKSLELDLVESQEEFQETNSYSYAKSDSLVTSNALTKGVFKKQT